MADTGFIFPTETGQSIGIYDGNEWTDPTNAYADDSSYATWQNPGPNNDYKTQSYYGFDFNLPNGALVTGGELIVKGRVNFADTNNTGIYSLGYYQSGLIGSGSPTYGETDFDTWTATDTEYTTGSSTTLLVPSQFRSAYTDQSFFVLIYANPGGTNQLQLNSVKVKLYYTPPAASLLSFFYP